MQKLLLATVAAVALSVAPAVAKDVKLPADTPVVTLSLPDDWSPKDIDNGAEATSPDQSTYIAFEVTDAKELGALIEEDIKYLVKQGVELDKATAKQSQGELNGMKGVNVEWDGKDKDGPTHIALTILLPTKEKAVLITYWGNAEGAKKNAGALDGIIKSVKPAS